MKLAAEQIYQGGRKYGRFDWYETQINNQIKTHQALQKMKKKSILIWSVFNDSRFSISFFSSFEH